MTEGDPVRVSDEIAELKGNDKPNQDPTSSSAGKKQKQGFFSRFKKKKDEKIEEEKPPSVKYSQLYQYATRNEKILIFVAFLCAALHGCIQPLFTVLFGAIIDSFGEKPPDQIVDEVGKYGIWFLVLGIVAFFLSYVQVHFQLIAAQGICCRLRRKYFESLMSQDYTWYDKNDGGELTARVAGDVDVIQAGIGDKFTSAVQFMAMFVAGIVIAFIHGPLLTLVILAVAPLLAGGGAVFGKFVAESTGEGLGAYGEAGAVATEIIGLIRVVTAYNGQATELKRYEEKLDKAYKAGTKKAMFAGFAMGFTMFVIFCSYAIAFAFGAKRVRDGALQAGDLLVTFFSVFIACISLGQGKFIYSDMDISFMVLK